MATITINYPTGTFAWVPPADVTTVSVSLYGAGGGGGGVVGGGKGGGGAGGGFAQNVALPVTPGTSYTIVIGAGGTGSSTAATAGGDSTFGSTAVVAKGGGAGGSTTGGGTGSAGVHGTGGVGATVNNTGGDGAAGGTYGGGGGSSASPSNNGNSSRAPSNTGANPLAGNGGGQSDLGATGQGGSGGTTSANLLLTPGSAYGGGGGGSDRTASGTWAGANGGPGQGSISFVTSYPQYVQGRCASTTSGADIFLYPVGAGSTVLIFLAPANFTDTFSAVTLSGGTGGTLIPREILGASAGSPPLSCYAWENVTGTPEIITATTAGGSTFYYGYVEVGNPGTITTGQNTAGSTTGTASYTPAAPALGVLHFVCAFLEGASGLGGYSAIPSIPYIAVPYGSLTGVSLVQRTSVNTNPAAAAWTQNNASNSPYAIAAVGINPAASRTAFMLANQ